MSPRTLSAIHANVEAEITHLRSRGYVVEDVTVEYDGKEYAVSIIAKLPPSTYPVTMWFGDYTLGSTPTRWGMHYWRY